MSKQRKSASKTPAKGKADKLITNAEAPAAECSRPMPPHGKGRTGVAQSVFSAIAEQLRAIPGRTGRIIDAENTAGRLLAEALKHGAFARIKHTHLRTWIDERIEKGLYCSAFGSAVNWFREYEPHWPAVAAWQNVGSSSCFKNGCPLLADVLEGEADVPEGERVLTPPVPGRLEAVAKAEELQRRKENARLHEQHLRRFGVVYGRRGGIVGGQPPAAAGAGKEDMGEVGPPSLPATPLSETRCVPMPLVELCRRYMDDKDARSDKVKPLLARYGLRQEVTAKNKWTIRLDDLDAKTRERITRPTYE